MSGLLPFARNDGMEADPFYFTIAFMVFVVSLPRMSITLTTIRYPPAAG
jgi:hypothetical protein